MRRGIALAGLALAGILAAGGAWLVRWREEPRLSVTLYAQNRLVAIQVHLDEAPPGYVLIAGDSHAELQSGAERVCGAETVSAGVSGAGAGAYADLLARLTFPTRPSAAVLTIGTNDLNRRRDPTGAGAAAAFEGAVLALVGRLKALTDTVVVTAVPPIGRDAAGRLDAAAVGDYSARIRALCRRAGCTYADPFADLREEDSGLARDGALRDGLHLARYRPVLRALAPSLCTRRGADSR